MKHQKRRQDLIEQTLAQIKKVRVVSLDKLVAEMQMGFFCMHRTALEYLKVLEDTGKITIKDGKVKASRVRSAR